MASLSKTHYSCRSLGWILPPGCGSMAFAGASVADAESHVRPAAQEPNDLPTNRPSSSGAIVVAVVLGSSGTVGSDVLAPYEVFASSPHFSVYTIAAQSAPAPIDGGPAIVPTYTFEDIRSGRARQPDVVVVPAVGAPEGRRKPRCGAGSWSNQAAARASWVSATDRASLPGLAS